MRYYQELRDKRWIEKRENILKRDNYTCQDCSKKKTRTTPKSTKQGTTTQIIFGPNEKISDVLKKAGFEESVNLQVHHHYYIEDHSAWEYPSRALITLCKSCHERLHERKRYMPKYASQKIADMFYHKKVTHTTPNKINKPLNSSEDINKTDPSDTNEDNRVFNLVIFLAITIWIAFVLSMLTNNGR